VRPLKPIAGQINLANIVSVDKGNIINFIHGGVPVRVRLATGKDKCFIIAKENPNIWIEEVEKVLGGAFSRR
jgi:hypothetical protein